jgi:hypothetical protein
MLLCKDIMQSPEEISWFEAKMAGILVSVTQ